MQISDKYGLVYVITKLGLLFVYDLETATAVYRNRISPDPIFLTAPAPGIGGFYAINRSAVLLIIMIQCDHTRTQNTTLYTCYGRVFRCCLFHLAPDVSVYICTYMHHVVANTDQH